MSEPASVDMDGAGTALRRTLEVLGDQWTLLIVQSVFLRFRRYEDLRLRLGISPSALAGRLREAVDVGILVRTPYRDRGRTRQEYRLTERGLALWPLLISIWAWEREWVVGRRTVLPTLVHEDCGRATEAPLACGHCLRPVNARTVTAIRSAGGVPQLTTGGGAAKRFRRKDAEALAGDPLMFFPDAMELLGDRWATGLLVNALFGVRHFSEFERELGIGPSVLSDRLSRLVAVRVLRTEKGSTRTDARAYRLTDKGRAFFPALAFIADWARGMEEDGREPEITFVHQECGCPMTPVLLCETCQVPLRRQAVRFRGAIPVPLRLTTD